MISPPRWEKIDTVLLDMDGTLLDRYFDDHFWLEHVPGEYARLRGMALEDAKKELFEKYRSQEGTLNWTDLDYWSERLGLDIPTLKRQVDHLIAVHPGRRWPENSAASSPPGRSASRRRRSGSGRS
jgi:putative hydrolase of the HAD superfamily